MTIGWLVELSCDFDWVRHAAVAAEPQGQSAAANGGVPVAQRRQAERAVVAYVLAIADAQERRVEQAHDAGERRFARYLRSCEPRQIAFRAFADRRERIGEFDQSIEFLRVTGHPPIRVVAVRLGAARVPAGGLKVAVRQRADPDPGMGRRNGQRVDSPQLPLVGETRAVGFAVHEPLPLRLRE